MILDFNHMAETQLEHFKGGEKSIAAKMFDDDHNKIIVFRLIPGASVGLHTHEGTSEIVYILQGTGKALYDDGEETLVPGVCHYCPEGHGHSIINNGEADLIFFGIIPKHTL